MVPPSAVPVIEREVFTLDPLSWWPKTSLSPAPIWVVTYTDAVSGT